MNYKFSPYQPEWKNQFLEIKKVLKHVFAESALEIEHVGSTSIEGMSAKPLIDILVTVVEMKSFECEKKMMSEAGYEWKENYIAPNSLLFYKTNAHGEKNENIHICQRNSPKAIQFIVMRDYLRAHPDAAEAYSDLKEKNAELYPDDYIAYRNAKKKMLDELAVEAYEWGKAQQHT